MSFIKSFFFTGKYNYDDDDDASKRWMVMLESKEPKKTILNNENCYKDALNHIRNKDWKNISSEEIIDVFFNISQSNKNRNNIIQDHELQSFFEIFFERIDNVDIETLEKFLIAYLFLPINAKYTEKFDDSFCKRIELLDKNYILRICNCFILKNLDKLANFIKFSTKHLFFANDLSKQQFVQILFYLGRLQKLPAGVKTTDLIKKIELHINSFTDDELIILSNALFKLQIFPVNKKLLKPIVHTLKTNKKNLPSFSISASLKLLRHIITREDHQIVVDLFNNISSELPRLSFYSLTCLVKIALSQNINHLEINTFIKTKLLKEISNIRLEEINTLIHCLTEETDGYIFLAVFDELSKPKRIKELDIYGQNSLSIIKCTAELGYLPYSFASNVLMSEFKKQMFIDKPNKFLKLSWHLVLIDYCIEIEHPKYEGFRLNPSERDALNEKYLKSINVNGMIHRKLAMKRIEECLKFIFGIDFKYFVQTKILPHVSSENFIFCTNKNKILMPIPKELENLPSDFLKKPPNNYIKDGITFNVIFFENRGSIVRKINKTTITSCYNSYLIMQLRQIKLLGFNVITIPFNKLHLKYNINLNVDIVENLLINSSTLNFEKYFRKNNF